MVASLVFIFFNESILVILIIIIANQLFIRSLLLSVIKFLLELIVFFFNFINFQTELLYPQAGYVEIDPDNLWNSIIRVINNAIKGRVLKLKSTKYLKKTTLK